MAQLLIRHKVKDYNKWKTLFDEHAVKRKAGGCKGGRLFRSASDPNDLVILFEWENVGKARQFTESQDLRQTMERAGVIGKPDLYFLEEVGKFDA